MKPSASSQRTSWNWPFFLSSGLVSRSGELATSCTCQPRTQIRPWLVGCDMLG